MAFCVVVSFRNIFVDAVFWRKLNRFRQQLTAFCYRAEHTHTHTYRTTIQNDLGQQTSERTPESKWTASRNTVNESPGADFARERAKTRPWQCTEVKKISYAVVVQGLVLGLPTNASEPSIITENYEGTTSFRSEARVTRSDVAGGRRV